MENLEATVYELQGTVNALQERVKANENLSADICYNMGRTNANVNNINNRINYGRLAGSVAVVTLTIVAGMVLAIWDAKKKRNY